MNEALYSLGQSRDTTRDLTLAVRPFRVSTYPPLTLTRWYRLARSGSARRVQLTAINTGRLISELTTHDSSALGPALGPACCAMSAAPGFESCVFGSICNTIRVSLIEGE